MLVDVGGLYFEGALQGSDSLRAPVQMSAAVSSWAALTPTAGYDFSALWVPSGSQASHSTDSSAVDLPHGGSEGRTLWSPKLAAGIELTSLAEQRGPGSQEPSYLLLIFFHSPLDKSTVPSPRAPHTEVLCPGTHESNQMCK